MIHGNGHVRNGKMLSPSGLLKQRKQPKPNIIPSFEKGIFLILYMLI